MEKFVEFDGQEYEAWLDELEDERLQELYQEHEWQGFFQN